MLVQQTQYTIEKLINRIRAGRLALPDFQRDFVWSPSQVADLLESISREWPIGSLLLLKGPQPFAFRTIDSAPDVSHSNLDLYVLDGQQRVTSIYHAVQNVSPFVYLVNFDEREPDADEVISWDRRPRFEKKYPSQAERAAAGIALVWDLWDNERFHAWLDQADEARRGEFVAFRERRLAGLQSRVYNLLAIELEQGIELEALAKIFETLNKTGIRLNAFDLLVAKLYPSGFNLRDQWDIARSEHPKIAGIDPDGLEIIKLIALLVRTREGRHRSRGVRQGDVLSLDSALISEYWPQAVSLYAQSLETIEDFGVTATYLVPNWSMVLGVAGCLLTTPSVTRSWWMSRLAFQTFAQAANTRIVAEFEDLMQGKVRLDLPEDLEWDEILTLPARSNGLLLRGMMALAIQKGAHDPSTGELLSEVSKVNVAAIDQEGRIGKATKLTDFSSIVFVAEQGRGRPRDTDVRDSLAGQTALQSQGINPDTLYRERWYLRELFE